MLVLESMEHALARGAHIYAEVVGYGNTDDAYHITSPDPEAAGIARAISLAVAEATLSFRGPLHQRSRHLDQAQRFVRDGGH